MGNTPSQYELMNRPPQGIICLHCLAIAYTNMLKVIEKVDLSNTDQAQVPKIIYSQKDVYARFVFEKFMDEVFPTLTKRTEEDRGKDRHQLMTIIHSVGFYGDYDTVRHEEDRGHCSC